MQNLYQGKQEQHFTVGDTTSDRWNLSLSSEEQLSAWLQIWSWTHSITNWLKHSCSRPWVFHNMVQRHRPYLIRFWKDYELLVEDSSEIYHKTLEDDVGQPNFYSEALELVMPGSRKVQQAIPGRRWECFSHFSTGKLSQISIDKIKFIKLDIHPLCGYFLEYLMGNDYQTRQNMI